MSSLLIDMRMVLERFEALKQAAAVATTNRDSAYRALELHDAALAYAAAVRKVARKDRAQ